MDRDQFTIEVELPAGAGIGETTRIVRLVDQRCADMTASVTVAWVIGRSAPAFYYNMVGNRDQAPGFAKG